MVKLYNAVTDPHALVRAKLTVEFLRKLRDRNLEELRAGVPNPKGWDEIYEEVEMINFLIDETKTS